MDQRVREYIRGILYRYLEIPVARVLQRFGVSPNIVTLVGFLSVVVGSFYVGMGHLIIGGILFLVGSILDLFDGALARISHRVTSFGAMLDSLIDRLGEAALYIGLTVYGLNVDPASRNLTVYMVVLLLALIGSQTVSSLRARGESLELDVRGGLMTRPERVIILSVGLVLGEATILFAMGFIAFFSLWTTITRLIHIWRNLKAS